MGEKRNKTKNSIYRRANHFDSCNNAFQCAQWNSWVWLLRVRFRQEKSMRIMRIVHTHTYTHTLTHVGSHCISVIYAPWPGSLMLHQMTRSNDWPSLSKRMLPYFFLSKRCSQRCHYGVLVLWLLYSSFGVSLLRQKKKKKLRRVSSSTFGVKLSLQPSNFRIISFHHRHIQYKLQQQNDISQLSCFFFSDKTMPCMLHVSLEWHSKIRGDPDMFREERQD